MTSLEIRKAIEDISLIRRILNQSDEMASKAAIKLRIALYVFAATASLIVLVQELMTGQANRDAFIYASLDTKFMKEGLYTVGTMLVIFCLSLVTLLVISAKQDNVSYENFVQKNFSYLKGVGFFSDLLIKFIVFSLFIIAAKGSWIGALFLIFLADYCFQGRFFKMPYKLELILGTIGLSIAGVQIAQANASLIPAFALCATLSAISIFYSKRELSGIVQE